MDQLADNIKLSNAMERVAFAGDGFGEYAYKGFYFMMDAGDDVDDAADIIIKNQRVADVVDNVPDNTRREIADMLIDNPDSNAISKKLVDKFDENGKIGVDEVIAENGVCFTGEALISTQFGMRRIDEIKPGDKVYSFDEKTQEVSLKRVLQTYEKESDELVHITVGDSVINATPTHSFYVPTKGWTEACKLRAGDVLYTVNGEYVVVEQVQHEILEDVTNWQSQLIEAFAKLSEKPV